MKYAVLILFCIFIQSDTIKIDSIRTQQSIKIEKNLSDLNIKLDSIISVLDTIKNKKR